MDSSHIRYDRTAEAGRPHPGEPDWIDQKLQYPAQPDRVEYLLRYSPLRRPRDFSPRRPYRGIAGAIERGGVNGGFSDAGGFIRGYSYLGHAFSLASCADESLGG